MDDEGYGPSGSEVADFISPVITRLFQNWFHFLGDRIHSQETPQLECILGSPKFL